MIKQKIIYSVSAVALLFMTACDNNELPVDVDNEQSRQLSIAVTDIGYSSVADMSSRTIEKGFATEFTAGDACGLYVVREGKLIYSNVKLTAERNVATGDIEWKPETGTTLTGGMSDEQYYLYYPYQTEMDNKTADSFNSNMTDDEFFAPLISEWIPQTDQSNRTSYTASDLMTSKGRSLKGENNTYLLSFYMTHKMALAVIELPRNVYMFTNSKIPNYTVLKTVDFSGEAKPMRMEDAYRYVVNPNAASLPVINGSFDNGSNEFTISISGMTANRYKKYKVAGAAVNNITYNLQRGDFLLSDGNLLSRDETLTEEQKANISAIIFWSPAETNTEGRLTPALLSDDKIRSRDFPHCTHGLAVSVNNMHNIEWQRPLTVGRYAFVEDDLIANFQNGNDFSRPDKSDFVPMSSFNKALDNVNRILGYQNTQIIMAYNEWSRATGRGIPVGVADACVSFATNYPAPAGSTGWYIPSAKELSLLVSNDIDNIDYWSTGCLLSRETADIVNNSHSKIIPSGLGFIRSPNISIWSSSEQLSTWDSSSKYGIVFKLDSRYGETEETSDTELFFIMNAMKDGYISPSSGIRNMFLYPVCAF